VGRRPRYAGTGKRRGGELLSCSGRGEKRRKRINTRVLFPKSYGARVLRVAGFFYSSSLFLGKTFRLTHLFLKKDREAYAPLSQERP